MFYLATQILVLLAISAALGFFIGWLIKGAAVRTEATSPAIDALVASELRAELGSSEEERQQQREKILRLREELARARVGLGDMALLSDLREQLAASQRECRDCREELERVSGQLGARDRDEDADADAPALLEEPETPPDDLKLISGIGFKLEATLNELGIYYFRQIADLTADNVAWLDDRLRFKGRIERERWVEQARRLAEGGEDGAATES